MPTELDVSGNDEEATKIQQYGEANVSSDLVLCLVIHNLNNSRKRNLLANRVHVVVIGEKKPLSLVRFFLPSKLPIRI